MNKNCIKNIFYISFKTRLYNCSLNKVTYLLLIDTKVNFFIYGVQHVCLWFISLQTHSVALRLSLSSLPLLSLSHTWNHWHFHPFFLFLSSFTQPRCLSFPHLIRMHGCIFGLCRDSLAPGGFSWNQFTLPVPSHWSTIYRPSTAGAAGRLFNRYIRCLTWQSIYSTYSPCFKHNIRNTFYAVFAQLHIIYTCLILSPVSPLLVCCHGDSLCPISMTLANVFWSLTLVLVVYIFWDVADQQRVFVGAWDSIWIVFA